LSIGFAYSKVCARGAISCCGGAAGSEPLPVARAAGLSYRGSLGMQMTENCCLPQAWEVVGVAGCQERRAARSVPSPSRRNGVVVWT
jgi:hypothetical protein